MGVELYLHGATITRWLRPDGTAALDAHEEQLQASQEAWARAPSTSGGLAPALRGAGLKLQFPVARENPVMPYEDGFASRLPWEVVAAVSSRGREGQGRLIRNTTFHQRTQQGSGPHWSTILCTDA
jgi:hypothetical protein